jgi:hypothetical protein
MKARIGKIARLPSQVREEVNVRLERSEPSPRLLAWLNALPAVRELLQRDFAGDPISKQNLSQWRRGGFQDWLVRRDFLADVRSTDADQAADVLAARYLSLIGNWDGKCTRDFEAKARVLTDLCRGVTELQREAHQSNQVRSNPGPAS